MAIDDLDVLSAELPQVFEPWALPPGWSDDWLILPVKDVEDTAPVASEVGLDLAALLEDEEQNERQTEDDSSLGFRVPFPDDWPRIEWPGGTVFAGMPIGRWKDSRYPPPDCLAFYLPFHHYYPSAWGIYYSVPNIGYSRRIKKGAYQEPIALDSCEVRLQATPKRFVPVQRSL